MATQDSETLREGWIEVRRGFGEFEMSDLLDGEILTASGLRDGGWIVWKSAGGGSNG